MISTRNFIFVILLAILLGFWIVSDTRLVKHNTIDSRSKQVAAIVDSVWYVPPGHMNTLQFDYLYYAKTTSGFKFRTTKLVNIGDTIYFSKK